MNAVILLGKENTLQKQVLCFSLILFNFSNKNNLFETIIPSFPLKTKLHSELFSLLPHISRYHLKPMHLVAPLSLSINEPTFGADLNRLDSPLGPAAPRPRGLNQQPPLPPGRRH